jgi:hypothetical protein
MMRKYLEETIGPGKRIDKLHGEASSRSFFRVYFPDYSRIIRAF